MDCLGEETIVGFVTGQLTNSAIVLAEEHFAGCADCRELLASAAGNPALRDGAELTLAEQQPAQQAAGARRFGKFELAEPLGQGGMGIVHRARIVGTEAWVALKRVKLPERRLFVDALHREIEAWRRIEHPGVVRILEQGTVDDVPFYTMELVEGESLKDRLAMLDAVREAARFEAFLPYLRIVQRLCETLAFLHGEGIIHRDSTPQNVIITHDEAPMLVDFGLAIAREGLGRDELTRARVVGGTRSYMAPEQRRGEALDERADLYAIGCLLYEIFTGAPPADAADHGAGAPVPPSCSALGFPAWLDELIPRLLAERRRARPAYAADLARELGTLWGGPGNGNSGRRPRAYVYRPELVGRRELLGSLDASLERARAQQGGARLLIAGESGVGKTRFALEAAARARSNHLRVVSSGCMPRSITNGAGTTEAAGETLYAFRGLLRAIADICKRGGPDVTDRLLGPRAKLLAVCEPELARLPGQDKFPDPGALPADAARFRLLSALEQTLDALLALGPLFLVLDDLQWIDELSLAFLETLGPTFPSRARSGDPGRVPLGRREPSDARALDRRLGRASRPRPPREVARPRDGPAHARHRAAPGRLRRNRDARLGRQPILHHGVRRAGAGREPAVARRERTMDFVTHDAQGRALPVPRSLGELLERRLCALTPESRRLIEFAAVLAPILRGKPVVASAGPERRTSAQGARRMRAPEGARAALERPAAVRPRQAARERAERDQRAPRQRAAFPRRPARSNARTLTGRWSPRASLATGKAPATPLGSSSTAPWPASAPSSSAPIATRSRSSSAPSSS